MLDNCHQLHFMLLLRKRMQEPRAILLGAIANGSQGSQNILTLQKMSTLIDGLSDGKLSRGGIAARRIIKKRKYQH
jgi:hypothetical protein